METEGVSVVTCVADDGSPNGQALVGVVSVWEDESVDAQSSMVWDVEADEGPDEDGVFLTVHQFGEMLAEANLWRRHKGHCPCECGCVRTHVR